MYAIKYRRSARNYIARLPLKSKTTIIEKIHDLAENPDNPNLDTAMLKGRIGWRLRVGKYRIIYMRDDDVLTIEIVKVRSRGDIYKG
ncbi:type II toxin-antitoxin system RelE/ParE family toxin [uncultured Desulfosarcina sp.]|uniref:type II toxin-antitoxin system RelE family toxin n=1 Tax=uncultured Desulfosarcina sp. TaxID=218289 RepID=UPI0037480CA8